MSQGYSKKSAADLILSLTPEEVIKLGKQYAGLESPIDISFSVLTVATLPPMEWVNFENPPKRMKISNSGTTALLSAKWHGPRPYLTNGPLTGTYVFSQLHFHWGNTFEEGSEHTMNGQSFPLEVHLMFFKNTYMTHEEAMKKTDGIVTVAYMFTLQENDNENFNTIISGLNEIQNPLTSYDLELLPLTTFLHVFNNDYFMYWGNILDKSMLWIISRIPLGISLQQLSFFHSMIGSKDNLPITKNFRSTKEINHRLVFHVNPSKFKSNLLLSSNSMAQTNKLFIKKPQIMMSQVETQNPLGEGYESFEKHDDINISVLTDKLSEFIYQKPTNRDVKELKKCNVECVSILLNQSSNNPAIKVDLKRKSQIKFQLATALMNLEKEEGNDYAFLEKYLRAKDDSMKSDKSSYNKLGEKKQAEEMLLSTVRSLQMNCNINGPINALNTPIKEKSKSDTHCLKGLPFTMEESDSEKISIAESKKSVLSSITSFSDKDDNKMILSEIKKGKKENPTNANQRASTAKLADGKQAFQDYDQNRWNRKAMLCSRSKISNDSSFPSRTNSVKSAVVAKKVSEESSRNRSFDEANYLKPIGQTVDEARDKIRSSLKKSMSKLLKMRGATADAMRQRMTEKRNRPAWRY